MTRDPLLPTTPDSELYWEWAPKLNGRRGIMVPQHSLGAFSKLADAGLRSVYLFSERDAATITAARSSRGFREYDVWSNCLFIDIDSGIEGLQVVLDRLPNVGMDIFESGSKGFHIHIPHQPIQSLAPEAHTEWVAALGLPADYSLYRRSSLIRLPGCVHPKTRRKKRLIMTIEGPEPQFWQPILKAPVKHLEPLTDSTELLLRAARLSESQPRQGDRHTALWSYARSMHEAGYSLPTTMELTHRINNSWPDPKDHTEVSRAVQQAFHYSLGSKST